MAALPGKCRGVSSLRVLPDEFVAPAATGGGVAGDEIVLLDCHDVAAIAPALPSLPSTFRASPLVRDQATEAFAV
jgi:hypothetical protein